MTSECLSSSSLQPSGNAAIAHAHSGWAAQFGRDVLLPFLATRAVLLLIARVATRYFTSTGQPPTWLDLFSRFDQMWYLRVASDGYFYSASHESSIAFAPLLPILMRIIGFAFGSSDAAYLAAGVLISKLALLVGLGFVHAIARDLYGDRAAKRAVLYILICPGTLYLSNVYPMSLMLAISAATIYLARRGRWELASAVGLLAPLTRCDGVLLLLPLVWEAARSRRADPRFLWLLMIPATMAIWLAGQWLALGTPLAFVHAQNIWAPSPFITVLHSSRAPLILGIAAVFILLTMVGWFDLPSTYSLYSTPFLLLMLSCAKLWSLPRFIVILFPCFITLAVLGARWKWLHILYVVTASLIAATFALRVSLGLWVA
jgi:hypothetical protein